jgi:hypothetical protein
MTMQKVFTRAGDPKHGPRRYGENPFGRRYPWREWFKQDDFTLVRGEHYAGMTHAMSNQVRNAAARPQFGLKVSIYIAEDGNSLRVRVLERPSTQTKKKERK